jgi:hypothetical protein
MKQMKDFRKWLAAVNADSTPLQRRLAGLTRLSREQIAATAAFSPWFVWGEVVDEK